MVSCASLTLAHFKFEGRFRSLHSVWDSGILTKNIRELGNYTTPLPSYVTPVIALTLGNTSRDRFRAQSLTHMSGGSSGRVRLIVCIANSRHPRVVDRLCRQVA